MLTTACSLNSCSARCHKIVHTPPAQLSIVVELSDTKSCTHKACSSFSIPVAALGDTSIVLTKISLLSSQNSNAALGDTKQTPAQSVSSALAWYSAAISFYGVRVEGLLTPTLSQHRHACTTLCIGLVCFFSLISSRFLNVSLVCLCFCCLSCALANKQSRNHRRL